MKLSFCIPTYNRKLYLEETVRSILNQRDFLVEIVISDNHSTDGTEELAHSLHKDYPNITYYRWDEEVECGRNLLKAVELARGEYCWLMTDDDRVEEGGVQHVLSILKQYPYLSGMSVNVEGYDCHLKNKKKIRYSHKIKKSCLFEESQDAFEKLGAWLGFWSAQVVRRVKWKAIVAEERHFSFLGYHHLYILLRVIKKDPLWFFTAKKCVGYRAGNESFVMEYGRVRRFEIDAFSYTAIGKELFEKKSVKKVNTLVLNNLLFWQLVTVKCQGAPYTLLRELLKISFRYYKTYGSFWCRILPLFVFPSKALLGIRFLYRCLLDRRV